MLDPKGMEAAREAWIASDVATRFFSDVEHCALEAAITAYLATLPQEPAPEPVGWFNPWDDYHGYQQVAKEYEGTPGTIPLYASPVASPPVSEDAVERIERIICDAMNGDPRGGSFSRAAHAVVTAFSAASIPAGVKELPENILEDAAKSAFVKAQSVYRADHDHFPLKTTWETTSESVREGWRGIAYAALEATYMPPLGTQPEPRHPRDVASALISPSPVGGQKAPFGWTTDARGDRAPCTSPRRRIAMMLDEKALEAACSAFVSTNAILGDQMAASIRAYLEAATPPDVAGLIERLEEGTNGTDITKTDPYLNALMRQAATALRLSAGGGWRTMDSAPKDGTEVLVYAPPYAGLGDIICKAAWHNDAGWCVDELRTVTHWQPLPVPPTAPAEGA